MLKLYPKFLNEAFLQKLEQASVNKSLYVIQSLSELNKFINKTFKISPYIKEFEPLTI
tara:strand:+ start:219 stop:392 length:174 start_codon:yes stop_codon:yes gene_type:complete